MCGVSFSHSASSIQVGVTETLQEQYEITKKETNTSHVMEYGDMVSPINENCSRPG